MINSRKPHVKQVNPDQIKNRFKFVEDPILQHNLSNTFSYIIFLNSLQDQLNIPQLYKAYTYKTIIVYSASIVESLLYYKLKTLLESKIVSNDQVFGNKYKYEELSKVILHRDLNFPIVLCKKCKDNREIRKNTQFHDLIKCAKRIGLLTETLSNHANNIKNLRNRIHMSPITEIDDKYEIKDVNTVFKKVKKLIDRIERY